MITAKTKLLVILVVVITATIAATAQSTGLYWPQDGDRVVKTHYEFVTVDTDSAVWDFSHAIATGSEHSMQWVNLGDSVLVRIEQGNQYTYRTLGDTVLWLGYENPLLGMRDSIAPIAMLPVMQPGDSVTSPCYFKGKYSGNHAVDMAGTHTVQLMRQGTLILPNDTITDAVLVREVTDGKVRVSPELTDAPISSDNDSLLHRVEVTDRWYSPSHRYPVAENVTGTFYVQGELRQQTRATYLCTPDVQELALGDVVQPRQNAPRQSHGTPLAGDDSAASGNNMPLGERLAVNVAGGHVDVTVSGTDGTDVTVILSDLQGRVWASRSGKTQGGPWQGSVSTSRLRAGDYLLYVANGEETHVERIKIK